MYLDYVFEHNKLIRGKNGGKIFGVYFFSEINVPVVNIRGYFSGGRNSQYQDFHPPVFVQELFRVYMIKN